MKQRTFSLFVFSYCLLLNPRFGMSAEQPSSQPAAPIFSAPEITAPISSKHEFSTLSGGIDFQYNPITYTRYDWLTQSQNGKVGNAVHLGGEWLPLGRYYGKLGVGINVGFGWINGAKLGNGQSATLYTLPIEPYLVYRMDYVENQFLVPFAKIGTDVTLIHQNLNSPTGPRSTSRTYYGFDYALGGEVCLNFIDRRAASDLDTAIGINGTYLTFEYLKSRQLKGGSLYPDLTHEEYRLGLRFEM